MSTYYFHTKFIILLKNKLSHIKLYINLAYQYRSKNIFKKEIRVKYDISYIVTK